MKGILVNYEYCTGCHSCEVACRNERGLAAGEFGIKVTEVGPYRYTTDINAETPYEWVYNPTITKACDMCASRTATGKMPACVQACQAWCLYSGEVEELAGKMNGKTRWALYTTVEQ
ncbi:MULTISPECIES: 4Fe-4S dicluster domain-containing protein [Gordonibacter]|uniref:Oxidoreductase n=1 Tax=Gordonibacter faecis TaxID=3047475 RepID=A0ABT7DM49_9ACTN|nr:4Fe-4S dicluster domain-containing protein [Gordonibacter sp. KGMB12511]MDJ1650608.1 oxidoreductase [Gordonibacter sp. KGMB12511]HIW75776.1 oxidoreductase [Candidatus Gordonibacter avicola]